MNHYYNEIDPYAAQWLRNLIAAGHLPQGDVDERSIEDVKSEDLRGYAQCHFFAGIGGWPLALRLAEWPEDRPVWTGSCPCQPLSGAGQRKGHADRRHLWPAFQRLIAECQPTTFFGEQVANKDGREWFCGVRADLEHLGYACGSGGLPAASEGAPHERQRIFFVADSTGDRCFCRGILRDEHDAEGTRGNETFWSEDRQVLEVRQEDGPTLGEWIPQPEPVAEADGIPGQLGQLRAYGNAIVPQVAEQFIRAFIECNHA